MSTPTSANVIQKASWSRLTTVQAVVATLAGIISITGGLFSMRHTLLAGKGSVAGVVIDRNVGRPLLSAEVEISNAESLVVGTLHTAEDGRYQLEQLKEGAYVVKASAVRHLPQTRAVTVSADQETRVNFDLVAIEAPTLTPPVLYRPIQPYPVTPSFQRPEASLQSGRIAVPARSVYEEPAPPYRSVRSSGDVTAAFLKTAVVIAQELSQRRQEQREAAESSQLPPASGASQPSA